MLTKPPTDYESPIPWSPARPRILVIACSDGRLEKETDDFLLNHLGISRYDRLYIPGGPGALASGGIEFARADQQRAECLFLVEAHGVTDVILIFHSGSAEGPDDAMCADYRRKFPSRSTAELRADQEADAGEVSKCLRAAPGSPRVRVYRAEVTPASQVRFVAMGEASR